MAANGALLAFEAGGEPLAIDAAIVREVIGVPPITRVPHAPQSLQGVANVRGAAVPILSVSALRGKEPSPGKRVLILNYQSPVGLLVDNVTSIRPEGKVVPLDLDELIRPALRSTTQRTIGRGRAVREEAGSEVTSTVGLLIFAIDEQEFALPVDQVKETLALSADVTPLPRSDGAVVGTIPYRGMLLPILSLTVLLGMRPRQCNHRKAIAIALVQGRPVGLVVDKLHSVTRVSPEALDPVPAVIARRVSEAKVNAICRLDTGRRLVSVLDSASLFHGVQSSQLPEFDAMTVSDDRGIDKTTHPVMIFKIGDQTFGLPADVVEEVVRRPECLTKIPRSPDFIDGVMNLRGHAIPVIDQRARFGVSSPASARDCIMIVSMGNLRAGFVIDQVLDVLRMRREAVTPAPEMTEGTKIFDRVATLEEEDGIVLLIDPAELLDETERQMLIALRNKASERS